MQTLAVTLIVIAVFTWLVLLIPMQPTPRLVVIIVAVVLASVVVLRFVAPGVVG